MRSNAVKRSDAISAATKSAGAAALQAAGPEQILLTGICADAVVITPDGTRKVQHLRRGDRLVTRGQGSVTIQAIREKSFVSQAIYVIAGSLGHYRLDRDTLLPAAQTVLVRDWRARFFGASETMLVAARELTDGEYIRDLGFMPMTAYQVICDIPASIYADGMELGTADAVPNVRRKAPA